MNIRSMLDHELHALLALYRHLHRTDDSLPERAVIENVVTHADHRGQRHGKALLDYALAFAWSQGCYKVMRRTGRKDEAAFRFDESAGFDRYEKQAFIAKPSTVQS